MGRSRVMHCLKGHLALRERRRNEPLCSSQLKIYGFFFRCRIKGAGTCKSIAANEKYGFFVRCRMNGHKGATL